jgi:polyisoprenoid-binding protein YceI
MKQVFFLIFLLSLKTFAFPLESKNGKSEFVAIGRPSAIKIVGHGSGPTGQLNLISQAENFLLNGEVSVDLDSFDTGISLRDQHMKEKYLETGKSKTATLKFTDAKIAQQIVDKNGEAKLSAILQLHGVEKPVEVLTTLTRDSGLLKAVSSFQIKISDFGIAIPSFSGMTVADQIQIKIETQIAKNDLALESTEKK